MGKRIYVLILGERYNREKTFGIVTLPQWYVKKAPSISLGSAKNLSRNTEVNTGCLIKDGNDGL